VAVPAATDTAVDVLPARAAILALSVPPVVAVVALAVGSLAGGPAQAVPTLLLALVIVLSWLRLQLLAADGRASLARLAEDEQRMRHQAFHDTLTGLANRQLFHDRLEHALAVHRRSHRPLALLFGDLDGFKKVNDEYGHDAGDLVLRTVAERMSACLRPTDTLARLGGDEFAVLLDDGDQPEVVVERLVSCVAEGVSLPRGTAVVHLSLGVAVVAGDDPTPTVDGLLAEADAAMYVAKRGARGARDVTPHEATTIDPVAPLPATSADDGRAVMQSALARDLSAGRLEVVYQPLVEPATGTVVGVEALARWRFAGIDVPPPAFVELAEQAGLGSALTDVVLDRAAGQLRRWSASVGHDRLTLSVNLTAGELDDDTLPARVAEVVARHGLKPGQLVLETTPAALGDGTAARRLHAAGAALSLVSSADTPVALGSLHGVPVSSMKITGGPVGGDDGAAESRVRVLRAVCLELDLGVVVEQIESPEQLAAVRRLGGLLAQGFLLARPAPAGDLDDVVLHGCPVPV
jgi:diguanylate cyclase (GGDEF)-like protein